MAQETLASLTVRIRDKLSEASTRFFTGEVIRKWINEAQDRIAADCPWVVMTTKQRLTVPNCDFYLLPSDVVEVKDTKLRTTAGTSYRVEYEEPAIMDQLKQMNRGGSNATTYRVTYRTTLEGIGIEFFQAPSVRVRMACWVFKRPVPLINANDQCELPVWLTQTVVDYCLWQAKVKDEEMQQAAAAQAQFELDLKDLRARRLSIQADQMNKTRSRRRVGGWWF